MINYEVSVILNATLADDQIDELAEKLRGLLTAGGAKEWTFSRWGRRKLAQPIEKEADGFFLIYFLHAEPGQIDWQEFQTACRYDENILRELVVKVPTKKKGRTVEQIVPEPNWLADFSMKLQPMRPRRRPDSRPPRRDDDRQEAPRQAAEPAAEKPAAEEAPAATEAPASEKSE